MIKSIIKRMKAFFMSLILIISFCGIFPVQQVAAYDYLSYGIDVSKHQGTIDWIAVKNAGVDFVIIRSGLGSYAFQEDPCFDANYADAKSVGLKCGTYWVSYAMSTEEAYEEADVCFSVINGCQFEFPVYYDMEVATQSQNLTKQKMTEIALAFCERMSSYGYTAGVYANLDWFTNYIDKNQLITSGYEIWQAQYPVAGGTVDPTNYDKSILCDVWQYSEDGFVDGIIGEVDLNVSYVNYNCINDKDNLKSSISVSEQTIPSGSLKLGSNFGIYGIISSNLPITKVWGGIYKQGADTGVQTVEDTPNATSYNLHGKFNNNLIFNNLAVGNYTYKIYAKDAQKTYTLIISDFSIGDSTVSSMTIKNQTIPSGTLKQGNFFGIYGDITSTLPIAKVLGGVYDRNGSKTSQYAESSPNTTTYSLYPTFDNKIIFNRLEIGQYTYKIEATDSSGKTYTLINSNFQIENLATITTTTTIPSTTTTTTTVATDTSTWITTTTIEITTEPIETLPLEDSPQIVVGTVKGKPGEVVEICIELRNNPGILAAGFEIEYDASQLKLIEVLNGELMAEKTLQSDDDLTAMPYAVFWSDAGGVVETDGVLVVFRFEIAEDASDSLIPVTLHYDPNQIFDDNLENVSLAVVDGVIEIDHNTGGLLGDVNKDGLVDLKDVVLIRRYIAGGWDVTIDVDLADVNNDAAVDLKDVVLIRRFIAGGWDVKPT